MSSHLPLVEKAKITFLSISRKAQLKQPIKSLVEASFSTVLSLANFIVCNNPSLYPPNYPISVFNVTQFRVSQYPEQHLNYNKLFEPWCDYLSELFIKNNVSQQIEVCYMWDFVGQDYINQLNPQFFQIKTEANNNHPNQIYQASTQKHNQRIQNNTTKKIAIINFALSQLRTDFFKPKMHLVGLFTGIFFNQGDQWRTYNVLKGEYPSMQDYIQLNTVILSGSSLSVNDQNPEVVHFVQTLKQAIHYNPKLKILGICFGHQTLAKMFGGKIVSKKLLTGVQTIYFDENLINQTPFFRRSDLSQNSLELSQYHKDFVEEIPQMFDIFAQSATCKIQSLLSKNKKYLSFQFHPEYSAEYIKGFEMRLEHYHIYDIQSSYSHTQRGSIGHSSSLWQIRRIIRNFLDWEVNEAQIEVGSEKQ